MIRAPVALSLVMALAACATPLHLRPVPLAADGRALGQVFLGGWDGHRLEAFNDILVEPGKSPADELAQALSALSKHDYGVVYVETASLAPEMASAHALFCPTAVCLAVLERKGAEDVNGWGNTVAVFELTGPKSDIVGNIWIAGGEVRPPGPTSWPLMCRNKKDVPRYVHPDGGALYPVKAPNGAAGFALFGPNELPAAFHQDGFAAPSETICDRDLIDNPPPKVDPALIQGPPVPPAAATPKKK